MNIARYGEAGAQVSGRPKGTVMTVTFQLEGQEFVALNGGPLARPSQVGETAPAKLVRASYRH